MQSVAPGIWQLDDIKKGLLCQLFGGTSKVRRNRLSALHLRYVAFHRLPRSREYLVIMIAEIRF